MGTIRLIHRCPRSIPPTPGLQQMQGALRNTVLQPLSSPTPPSFPLSQPSCSNTWVQNHDFSKSLKTTQRGSQGTRGFQRRAVFPFISKSCPTADHTHTHTRTEPELLPEEACSALLSPPSSSSSRLMKTQDSQGFPSPIPQPSFPSP